MQILQQKNRSGIVSVVIILIVLVASAALIIFLFKNSKGVANAENTTVNACAVDVNSDGTVNKEDLKAISSQFGTNIGAPYDVNGDNSVDILDISAAAKFNGQTCSRNVAIGNQAACSADLNHNGIVDKPDLTMAADDFNKSGASLADLNNDGTVNILDLSKIANVYGQKCAANAISYCAIADANHDGIVDKADLQIMAGDFGNKSAYDLDGDGKMSILDLSKAAGYFGQKCSVVTQGAAPVLNASPAPVSTSAPANTTIDTAIANNCNGADVDRDGAVTILDLQLVQKDFGKSTKYDTDGDGMGSILDISKVNSNYGKKCKA